MVFPPTSVGDMHSKSATFGGRIAIIRSAPAMAPPIWAHVWTAPSWQGFSSRVQDWSVRPCVRPLSAVHVTAGHNALRGSGPGQKDAFDNAMAHVGCPDRRIDRVCITCCSPSQPSHHAGYPVRDLVQAASAAGSL